MDSYIKLNDIVDQVFPSVRKSRTVEEPRVRSQFSDLNFWRDTIPEPDLTSLYSSNEEENCDMDSQYDDEEEEDEEDAVSPIPVRSKSQLFSI